MPNYVVTYIEKFEQEIWAADLRAAEVAASNIRLERMSRQLVSVIETPSPFPEGHKCAACEERQRSPLEKQLDEAKAKKEAQ
ncbi:MAG TPA: hypothetical protein VFA39_15520 [Steroidobacteraceae bacterium]|nr:hypothetical protein [Steroidobacteraceae bacterium]